MPEKAALANVQFCKLQDEPKTKHKKGKHELLIDWVRSSQIWKEKKLAPGWDPHFEKVNNKGSGFKT